MVQATEAITEVGMEPGGGASHIGCCWSRLRAWWWCTFTMGPQGPDCLMDGCSQQSQAVISCGMSAGMQAFLRHSRCILLSQQRMHCSNRHCWGPGQQEVRITQLPTHGIKVAQIYADRGGSRKGAVIGCCLVTIYIWVMSLKSCRFLYVRSTI